MSIASNPRSRVQNSRIPKCWIIDSYRDQHLTTTEHPNPNRNRGILFGLGSWFPPKLVFVSFVIDQVRVGIRMSIFGLILDCRTESELGYSVMNKGIRFDS